MRPALICSSVVTVTVTDTDPMGLLEDALTLSISWQRLSFRHCAEMKGEWRLSAMVRLRDGAFL